MYVSRRIVLFLFSACLIFSACNKKDDQDAVLVEVGDKKLTLNELMEVIPDNSNAIDSAALSDRYIQEWIMEQLIVAKAEVSLPEDKMDFNELIENYRKSLLTYAYEQEWVSQKLDTMVTENEIEQYYNDNDKNFQLKGYIVKVKFCAVDAAIKVLPQLKKLFYSVKPEDHVKWEQMCVDIGANYYFNEQNRDAVWQRAQALGDFSKVDRRWVLNGKLAGEDTPVRIQIDSLGAKILLGSRTIEISFAEAMSDAISKRREGGLLVALRAWQQLLQVGPKQIGETIYMGTAPIYASNSMVLAEQPLHDVLQSAWYDTVARFNFPQDSGEIRCIEVFGDASEDPVEVYFDHYREKDKRTLPGRIRLQYGTEPTILMEIESISFMAEEAKP